MEGDGSCHMCNSKMSVENRNLELLIYYKVIHMFYCTFIESVSIFCIICLFDKATEAQKM